MDATWHTCQKDDVSFPSQPEGPINARHVAFVRGDLSTLARPIPTNYHHVSSVSSEVAGGAQGSFNRFFMGQGFQI